jgi:hypothetical protein
MYIQFSELILHFSFYYMRIWVGLTLVCLCLADLSKAKATLPQININDEVIRHIHQTRKQIITQMSTALNKKESKLIMTGDTKHALIAFDSSLDRILRELPKRVDNDQHDVDPKKLALETLDKMKQSWMDINSGETKLVRRSFFEPPSGLFHVPEIEGFSKVYHPDYYLKEQRQSLLDGILIAAGKPLDLIKVLHEYVLPIETKGWSVKKAATSFAAEMRHNSFQANYYARAAAGLYIRQYKLSEEKIREILAEMEFPSEIEGEFIQATYGFIELQEKREREFQDKLAKVDADSMKAAEIRHEAAKIFWTDAKELINRLFFYQATYSSKGIEDFEKASLQKSGFYKKPTEPLVLEPIRRSRNVGLRVLGSAFVASLILNLVVIILFFIFR